MITENKTASCDHLPNLNYSAEAVMAKKQICYFAVLSLLEPESLLVCFPSEPEEVDLSIDRLCDEQRQEISDHLYSYTEKPLVCEIENKIWMILPSFYPSSTLFAALVFDSEQFTSSEVLRLLNCEQIKRRFAFSKHLKTSPSRMSDRLAEKKADFLSLCDEINTAFSDINKMPGMIGEELCRDELIAQTVRLSKIFGVPLVCINEENAKEGKYSKTDYPLFTAYLVTFMVLAKSMAKDRSVGVSFSSLAEAVFISLDIDTDESLLMSSAILAWERITDDKNMIFEHVQGEGTLRIGFHPMRFDWGLLGLKQGNEFHKIK